MGRISVRGFGFALDVRECAAIECRYDPRYDRWELYPVDADGNLMETVRFIRDKREAMLAKEAMEAGLVGRKF